MKIIGLCLAALLGAATVARANTAPVSRRAPAAEAHAVLRDMLLARGYGDCVFRCEARYRACMSVATTADAERSCRLDRNVCESDCTSYSISR
jgi:hypothetical protein